MKSLIILLAAISTFGCTQLQAQDGDKAIRQAITQFANAADANDVAVLSQILHASYRIVWPQPDKDPLLVSRDLYLEKIGNKEWGGDDRKITIEWVKTNGAHATALIILEGKAKFSSLLDLVNVKGKWLVTQDAVEMKTR